MLASAEEKNRETYLSGLSYKSWLLPVTWTRASALLFATFQKQLSNVIFLKHEVIYISLSLLLGFPGSSDGKESAYNEGDPGLIPGFRRSHGEGNDYPLQYSCMQNSMDKEAWQAVHGVTKGQSWLSNGHFQLTFAISFFAPLEMWLYSIPTSQSHSINTLGQSVLTLRLFLWSLPIVRFTPEQGLSTRPTQLMRKNNNNAICSNKVEHRGYHTKWSQIEKEKIYDITYMWNLKKNGANELIYKTEIEPQMQKTIERKAEKKAGRSKLGDWNWHIHTAIYKIDNKSSQPRYRTRVSHIVGRRFTIWATKEVNKDTGNPDGKRF